MTVALSDLYVLCYARGGVEHMTAPGFWNDIQPLSVALHDAADGGVVAMVELGAAMPLVHAEIDRLEALQTCHDCDGRGVQRFDRFNGVEHYEEEQTCSTCKGGGRSLADEAVEAFARLTAERDALIVRRDELLASMAKLSRDIPYPEERGATGTLIAEVGTLKAQLARARAAARLLADRIDDMGMAMDDSDPNQLATAGPVGDAEAELFLALGILKEEIARREAKVCGRG